MSPVHAPGENYPTVWEQLLKMMGRSNKAKGKKQGERGRTKGGRKPAKPPHRGGKGGWGLFDDDKKKGDGGKKGWLS